MVKIKVDHAGIISGEKVLHHHQTSQKPRIGIYVDHVNRLSFLITCHTHHEKLSSLKQPNVRTP